jgi:hypothetical protein
VENTSQHSVHNNIKTVRTHSIADVAGANLNPTKDAHAMAKSCNGMAWHRSRMLGIAIGFNNKLANQCVQTRYQDTRRVEDLGIDM